MYVRVWYRYGQRWGWVDAGRGPLASASVTVGMDLNLHPFAQFAQVVWRVVVVRLWVKWKAHGLNSRYSGKHLEWKASDLCFSLALLCGPRSVTAPLWETQSPPQKRWER